MNFDDHRSWPSCGDGATLSQIEQATGVSRGVAIGRIHRLRKAGDARFQPRPPKPKVRRVVKPRNEVVGNSRPLPPASEPSGPRLLVDLAAGRCKFPVSDPPPGRGVEMLFCAEPVAQPGANYCGRHAEIVRVRVSSSPASRFVLRVRSRRRSPLHRFRFARHLFATDLHDDERERALESGFGAARS